MNDLGSSSYFVSDGALKLGYSYQTCAGTSTGTSQYLSTYCAGYTTASSCPLSCKYENSACVPRTSAEVKTAAGCTSGSTGTASCTTAGATQTCPATMTGSNIGTTGSSKCKCIDPHELGAVSLVSGTTDKVAFVGFSGFVAHVSKTYATTCDAWDKKDSMQYSASCNGGTTGTVPSWCSQVWCYVDMCNCDKADKGASSYFGTLANGVKLGYSYETCSTSTSNSGTATYLATFCGSKAQSSCTSSVSCTWSNGACVAATQAQMYTNAGCGGNTNCPCINPVTLGCVTANSATNMVTFKSSNANICEVPNTYGSGCSAWDTAAGMEYSNSCTGSSPPSWCAQTWCYVDLCNCGQNDLGSSTYFESSTSLKLGYSYTTCSGAATGTSSYLTTFCNGKSVSGGTCASTLSCKVSGTNCVARTTTEIRTAAGCSGSTATATTNCPSAPAAPSCTVTTTAGPVTSGSIHKGIGATFLSLSCFIGLLA